jgi:hypothetical protein
MVGSFEYFHFSPKGKKDGKITNRTMLATIENRLNEVNLQAIKNII